MLRRGKSGGEDHAEDFLGGEFGAGGNQPLFHGFGPDGLAIEPGAVILDGQKDAVPRMDRGEMDGAGLGFSFFGPFLGCLDAVVDAVTNQMHQGIVKFFDDRLVQFGLGPDSDHLDLFAEFLGEVVYQPAELDKGGANREHPDVEGVVTEAGGQAFHLFGDGDKGRLVGRLGVLAQPGLDSHHFAHKIDQDVKLFGGDPDAGAALLGLPLFSDVLHILLFRQRRSYLFRCQYP